ncbi:hypothetical protein GFS24_10975 [Chitinophaga sp. SYP-B3965]|uniref:FKBP-type peptidyl-prolyl cis-trans isomerase n=1 Tax=Chitinophaga sp. SYP-B3965 TaxID=2663120 RepID=UPI0012999072|nr:FKBP-type peptidyl-prolyl cis-trans isomerase [Chitinophaga sp. SYP-B3965]MRG45642.1 hypothetical protein [Chitinophaga sp. SYP-B3965]
MIKKHFFHLHLLLTCCLVLLLSSCAKKYNSTDLLGDSIDRENTYIRDYLRSIGRDSGLMFHPSGICYKIILPGNGVDTIRSNSIPSIVYTTKILAGDKLIESSQNLPTSFDNRPIRDHILGWQIGLTLITKGGRIILYIPSSFAYGHLGVPPNIPPNAILESDITLVDFK